MHAAPSLIAFTTLSGAGFGLMVWLGLMPGEKGAWVAGVFCAMALGLAVAGLLSSLAHLRRPDRAWRALSQWRSSWLSREGVAAIVTLAVFAAYGLAWASLGEPPRLVGTLAAGLALITVLSTGMIYAQLRAVPRWHHWSTPALFLGYALSSGGLLAGRITPVVPVLLAVGALQFWAWRSGDGRLAAAGSTLGTATGLGDMGRLRQLEPPHTGPNYVLREMGGQVGRRHAAKLRVIALGLAVGVPLALILLSRPFGGVGHELAGVIVLSHLVGIAVARWLFFAEAEHVSALYYGRHG